MTPGDMADREWAEKQNRWTSDFVAIVKRWPNHAPDFATAFLGHAIGIADSFGIDVEGFLVHLRKTHPKPPPLVRNRKASS